MLLSLPIFTGCAVPPQRDVAAVSTYVSENPVGYFGTSVEAFQNLPATAARIDFGNINPPLLDAAVFHETNRRRAGKRLPTLGFSKQARECARTQADAMLRTRQVTHENPEAGKRTLADRVASVGFKPRFYGENVAMTFGIRYQPGTRFYPRVENGIRIASTTAGGPPIPRHSYRSFAESLVDQWMDSAGHRRNILSKFPTLLGVSCLLLRDDEGIAKFYCSQVFLAPVDE